MKERIISRTETAGKTGRRRAAVFCAALMLGAALLFCGCSGESGRASSSAGSGGSETDSNFASAGESGEERTPVARLGENVIYLDEAVFYLRMLQEQWEYAYAEQFGEELWQQEADDGQTFEELLKNDVLSLLTEIELLCSRAEEYGAALDGEDLNTIAERAAAFMETNTPETLEAAGATLERVERYLARNELAARTAELIQSEYEPEIEKEAARVGKLTYCLFSSTGTYDAEGTHTPFTEEELAAIQQEAEAFSERARELGDISAAGEEISHTVIDVYFNDNTDGGAHELVAEAARALEDGGVSEVIETEDGWYVVQRVSGYDERATQENLEALTEQAKEQYLLELEAQWEQETPLEPDGEVWDAVRVDQLLTQ